MHRSLVQYLQRTIDNVVLNVDTQFLPKGERERRIEEQNENRGEFYLIRGVKDNRFVVESRWTFALDTERKAHLMLSRNDKLGNEGEQDQRIFDERRIVT